MCYDEFGNEVADCFDEIGDVWCHMDNDGVMIVALARMLACVCDYTTGNSNMEDAVAFADKVVGLAQQYMS